MRKSKFNFVGKTALVTGSTRGIGRSIADLFLELGCQVITTGTKEAGKAKRKNEIHLTLDLSDDASLATFLKKIDQTPAIDILVNNAGINIIEPIPQVTQETWEKILKVNLTGPMILMNAVAQKMIDHKIEGRIVNISSIFGVVSRAKRDSYSASKAGLIGLTKASALDLAPHKILVNAICPGFVLTDLTRTNLKPEEIKKLSREVPLRRMAHESEIAQAVVFLCSQLNTYITGQAIIVDGGFTAK